MIGRSTERNGRAGFTMIEALVAITIFGIGTVALLALGPRAVGFTSRSRQVGKASQLAQAKLEELRTRTSGDADLAAGTHADDGNPIDGVFTRAWTVVDDTPIAGMRRIEVRVSFPTTSPDSVTQLVTYF
jgi:prepilin-type N-terminal cleavage/methylation domain-containing protein